MFYIQRYIKNYRDILYNILDNNLGLVADYDLKLDFTWKNGICSEPRDRYGKYNYSAQVLAGTDKTVRKSG